MIRHRHPFPDVEEREPAPTVEADAPDYLRALADALDPANSYLATVSLPRLLLHEGENRKMRKAGVATFEPHADLPEGPGLRRRLVKQRQRSGTLDPELRRLQKAKLRKAKR